MVRLLGVQLLVVLVGLGVWGCRAEKSAPEPDPVAELPIEDVAPAVDAAIDVAADQKAIARTNESVGGVLPEDFPTGVSLPRPASITDITTADGWSVVELRVGLSPGAAGRFFSEELPRGGWREADGAWNRDGVSLRVAVAALPEGARVRLAYR